MVSDRCGEDINYIIDLIMNLADLDGDGHTDFEEFLLAASAVPDSQIC